MQPLSVSIPQLLVKPLLELLGYSILLLGSQCFNEALGRGGRPKEDFLSGDPISWRQRELEVLLLNLRAIAKGAVLECCPAMVELVNEFGFVEWNHVRAACIRK